MQLEHRSAVPVLMMLGTVVLCVIIVSLLKCLLTGHGRTSLSKRMLVNRTVIITGASSGIGKETAVEMAKQKTRVFIACRNQKEGEKTAEKIRKRSGNNNVFFMHLDLASMDSIRSFAKQFLEAEPGLDILINNARASLGEDNSCTRTKDGFEMKMGVNHLGHFLLTNLLLERMKESTSARIVVVSSDAYKYCSSFDFDNMNNNNPERYKREHNDAYRQSKLANILFIRELGRRLRGTSVTVNAVHPGTVVTKALDEFLETFPLILRPILYTLSYLFLKSPKQGAQTSIYCAVAEEVENVSGKYFVNCQPCHLTTSAAMDDKAAEKLWKVSSQLVGLGE